MAEETQLNPDFKITVNLVGVEPAEPFMEMPTEGVYKVKTTAAGQKENGHLQLESELLDGKNAGMSLRITVASDEKSGSRRGFLAALISHGHDKAKVTAGDIAITAKAFVGREAFIYYRPKAEGEQYDTRKFITPERYKAMKAKDTLNTAATAGDDFEVEAAPAAASSTKGSKGKSANGVSQPAAAGGAALAEL